jgi:hypothetical protein
LRGKTLNFATFASFCVIGLVLETFVFFCSMVFPLRFRDLA